MSKSQVIAIIEKAIDDKAYRNLLLNNPDEALKGYELTATERNRLVELTPETFDDFAGPLTGRNTKGQWIPGG